MSELEATARAAGMNPAVIEAVCRMHESLARAMPAGPDADASSNANARTNDTNANGHANGGGLAASVRDLAERLKKVE